MDRGRQSLWRELNAWIAGRHPINKVCIGVCAPSGFGKTASIASWAAQLARPYEVVWLHCTRYPTYEFS